MRIKKGYNLGKYIHPVKINIGKKFVSKSGNITSKKLNSFLRIEKKNSIFDIGKYNRVHPLAKVEENVVVHKV